ncbi:MAG: SUMF1/EgtB/PvdO family nonheme iron enzyme [Candidatus Saganbacteria bacterium]|nr:SUMF1/EgtB/PvdO family nonheme iron enzyme [Candidatus Saganbacteria bacterium]
MLKLISFNASEALQTASLPDMKQVLDNLDPSELRLIGLPVAKPLIPKQIEKGIIQRFVRWGLIDNSLIILPSQEIIEMYERGEMPPIGAMVQIEAGEYGIGVKVDSFLIGVYAVTNQEIMRAAEDGLYQREEFWSEGGLNWKRNKGKLMQMPLWLYPGDDNEFNRDDQPVVAVTWYEAEAYLNWAGLRFPKENEWEIAARGGLVNKLYPWGNEEPDDLNVHYGHVMTGRYPVEVNAPGYRPNGYGLFHTAGNVLEWCQESGGEVRNYRGSSFEDYGNALTVAHRRAAKADLQHISMGFRAVKGFQK